MLTTVETLSVRKAFRKSHILTFMARKQPALPAAIQHVTEITHKHKIQNTQNINSMTSSHISKQTIKTVCCGEEAILHTFNIHKTGCTAANCEHEY